MNLRTLDLNLLRVFDMVYRERSVTKAGDRLGLTQPALSHALSRLRWSLKDEIFVRTPGGMMPTARAEQLAEPIRRALLDLQSALEPEVFRPAETDRRFSVAVNNFAAVVLAPPIAAEARALAPNLRLSLRPSGTLDLIDLLDRGDLDLAIAAREAPADRFISQTLIEDRYVVAMRRGHPALRGRMTLKTFARLPHLAVSSIGEDLSFVDDELAKAGAVRNVLLEAPYLSAGGVLIQSDMVAILGSKIALEFSRSHPIALRPLPFKSSLLKCVMLWHRRFDGQPAHKWLRGIAASVAKRL